MTSRQPIRVGIVGAGPVSQAIHLPALASLAPEFTVTHVVDIAEDVAAEVARRAGARWSTSIDDLLADPEVDAVAICSPHHLHAAQVIAAFEAGKAGVLCEKPLAVTADEAKLIADAAAHHGSALVVGSMHKYDPAWTAGLEAWRATGETPHTIRSSIIIPPNARFEDFAADIISRPPPPLRRGDSMEEQAGAVERSTLGLGVHDIPLVRALAGGTKPEILWAESLRPLGYRIVYRLGETTVDTIGRLHPTWQHDWSIEAIGTNSRLRVDFTPSYVLAGGGTAKLTSGNGSATLVPSAATNGYQGEWLHLAAVMRGETAPDDPRELIDDLDLTLAIASRAADWIRNDATTQQEMTA